MADAISDQWVALASDQRRFDSHVLPSENRSTVREAVLRHIVADELLVAVEDDDLLGFVMFAVEGGDYAQDVRRGVVRNIYVEPAHRGRGIGGELLGAAEAALADRDVDRVTLEVMVGNESARRFYRRHGYEPHRLELEKPVESDTL